MSTVLVELGEVSNHSSSLFVLVWTARVEFVDAIDVSRTVDYRNVCFIHLL